MNTTDVYILSGFLGTGKTTLLKEIIQHERKSGRSIAVLMNELGQISIDSEEINSDVPLKELLGGCICCTIQDKLEGQLQGLLFENDLDAIYIETTGAAHPVEVLDAVLSPLFAQRLNMKGIVTTVDGTLWLNRRNFDPQIHQLLLEQVKNADLIIINKSDLLTMSEQGTVNMEIQMLNMHAKSILTNFSKVPFKLIEEIYFSPKGIEKQKQDIEKLRLSTFVYTFKNSINKDKFEDFLRGLPNEIYRVKGYVKFENSSYPDLFQYSYGMPLYMKEYMKMPLNLVFIGKQNDWSEIKSQLEGLEK